MQITSNDSGPLRYVAGLFYLHERSFYNYYISGAAIDGGFGPLAAAFGVGPTNILFAAQGPGLTVKSFAPYIQADYDVASQLILTVGARYTIEKKSLINNDPGLVASGPDFLPQGPFINGSALAALGIPGLGGNCVASSDLLCYTGPETIKFNTFTPKVTLSYKPSTDLMLYVTASRGFKSGGLELPSFGFVNQVKPETLDDLEGGWKYQSGPLRFNGAIFYYWYKDLQLPIVNPVTGTTNTRNAATARNYGIETDITYRVTPRLEIGAGGGYLNARFRDFPNGPAFANGSPAGLVTVVVPNLKGRRLANIIQRFNVQYRFGCHAPWPGHSARHGDAQARHAARLVNGYVGNLPLDGHASILHIRIASAGLPKGVSNGTIGGVTPEHVLAPPCQDDCAATVAPVFRQGATSPN